jgi:hypothetical protein
MGVVIGIVGLLFWKQKPTVVQKYPHPTNVEKNVYKDPNGVCYKYKSSEVDCDKNESTIKPYPIQEGMAITA